MIQTVTLFSNIITIINPEAHTSHKRNVHIFMKLLLTVPQNDSLKL